MNYCVKPSKMHLMRLDVQSHLLGVLFLLSHSYLKGISYCNLAIVSISTTLLVSRM